MGDPGETRRAQSVSADNEVIVREQFNSLTRLVPALYGTIVVGNILLSWVCRDVVPLWLNLSLTLSVLSVIAVRLVHWIGFRGKAYDLDLRTIERAIRGTTILGPALSFGFSIVGFLWIQQRIGVQQTFTLMSIWVLASACSFCLFSLPVTAIVVLIVSSVPLCLALMLSGDSEVMLETPAFISISALMIYVLRENYRVFKEIVESRTKMKDLQEELRQKHKHLALAQRVGEVGSAEVNLRTGDVMWSEQLFTLLDLDPGAVRPSLEAFVAAVHPDDREMVREAATRNRRGLSAAPMEFRVLRADGTVRWLAWASDLVVSDEGAAEEVIATVHDITERTRIEAQLAQAQKMEAVGHLTGGVAHDFNNLLAVILGRLQLLDEELGDRPELRNWVRSSLKAVDRGATLTKSLLAFSRRQALTPVELDLNAVIDDVDDMLRRTLGETYEFRVAKASEPWHVEADPGQLQNALLNLVLNARDAMPNGGTLVISTANVTLAAGDANRQGELQPGDYVMLAVSDTGAGMSREVAERAFEPFFTTKDVDKGSGLGLSMVYGFVKQSGGHVTLDSQPGRGTTVRIYLPRKVGARSVAQAKDVDLPSVPRGTSAILVVEDNDELRQLTRDQLERLGYTVLQAGDGAEGLRILRETPGIDLLLTDVVMPHGMSGPELAETATALLPKLKVIFMSGYTEQRDMLERARGHGTLRLLQKPFHVLELATLIRAALD